MLEASVTSKLAPKRRLFVHIGLHKTGTSSIQYALHTNIPGESFPEFLFPTTGRDEQMVSQHARLAHAFRYPSKKITFESGTVDRNAFLATFLAELQNFKGDTIIISSEDFCFLSRDQVADFAKTFSDFDITPVFYIRNIADFKEKFHQTMVHLNFYSNETLRDPQFKFWNYLGDVDVYKIAENWASVAFDRKVVVADYDSVGVDGKQFDSVAAFLEIVGLDSSAIKLTPGWKEGNKSKSPMLTLAKVEMIKANVQLEYIEGLLTQLSKLPLLEKQALLPPAVRDELEKAYEQQRDNLIQAEFVTMAKVSSFPGEGLDPAASPTKNMRGRKADSGSTVFLTGLPSLIFAIGRAVSRANIVK